MSLSFSESVASINLYAADTILYDIQLHKQKLESNLQNSLALFKYMV